MLNFETSVRKRRKSRSIHKPGRKSSLAAIFDDNRRRDETVLKANRPNLRGLRAKYDVPHVIGEEVFNVEHTLCETTLIL
jgi:hypothetical protein